MKKLKYYSKPKRGTWTGRSSKERLYIHEKIGFLDFEKGEWERLEKRGAKTFSILGYACDEGIRRNHGRPGAVNGPEAIKTQFGKMPNHLRESVSIMDLGSLYCTDRELEAVQAELSEVVSFLIERKTFPILIGGGHDIAYGHFQGIRNALPHGKRLGIINFDAHFDLRTNDNGNHSGSPFYQIARQAKAEEFPFSYLCLGIRKDANDSTLYHRASVLGVKYIEIEQFRSQNLSAILDQIREFVEAVDFVYTTIDLDGFSSAYAPGVSAAFPMGFGPDMVKPCLQSIIDSGKLISLDIAEMNPLFDRDEQTAKLAAGLLHFIVMNPAYSSQD